MVTANHHARQTSLSCRNRDANTPKRRWSQIVFARSRMMVSTHPAAQSTPVQQPFPVRPTPTDQLASGIAPAGSSAASGRIGHRLALCLRPDFGKMFTHPSDRPVDVLETAIPLCFEGGPQNRSQCRARCVSQSQQVSTADQRLWLGVLDD